MAVPGFVLDTQGRTGRKKKRRDSESLLVQEKQLEELVFGRQLFDDVISDADHSSGDEYDENEDRRMEERRQQKGESVWHDEDDDVIKVNLTNAPKLKKLRKSVDEDIIDGKELTNRLRQKFEMSHRKPNWSLNLTSHKPADGSSEEDEEDEEMMERAGRMLSDKVSSLPAGNINIKQLPDGNKHKTSPGVIQVVEFHPSSDVLMTAGLYKTLSLYQIDNESNPLIQSIHLERFPIHHCHFSTCGKEVIVTGNKRWYYLFDMYTGRVIRINEIKGHRKTNISNFKISPDNTIIAFTGDNGYIHLISNKSKQWIADLKMNGNVIDVEFTPDGSHLLSTGSDGHVYIWSMSSRNCVHRFTDEGATRGTSIAISSNGAHIACGSDSGVVNLYNKDCYHESSPRPYKTIMNLTTSVDHLTFNHSSEILALSSKAKRASLKLYHIQSQSVFSNWPLSNMTCLKTIYGHSFSHDSRALSLGNDNGRALMFRLNHYNNGGTKLD